MHETHKKALPDRSFGRRMDTPRRASADPRTERAAPGPQLARGPERRLLHRPRRLCLAAPAARLPALEDGLPLLPLLALGRDLGEAPCRPAPAGAGTPQEGLPAQRGHSGFPVGKDDRGRRSATRVRRGQEGEGPEAPPAGRHAGFGARSAGPRRKHPRPGGYQAPARTRKDRPPAPLPPVDGRGLYRPRQGGWVEGALGWTAEIVRHPSKLVPEEVMRR